MRCLMCGILSLTHICDYCQEHYLKPSLYRRKLPSGVEVISFYKYREIKELLHTKHTDLGFYIFKILAQNSFEKFAQTFEIDERVVSIPIDDTVTSGYSHTAILNKSLHSRSIKALFGKLRARNHISYSGKSRAFRLLNPRDFQMQKFKGESVLLVDDIITTGATLTQAIETLHKEDKEVILCLTLCDVSNTKSTS